MHSMETGQTAVECGTSERDSLARARFSSGKDVPLSHGTQRGDKSIRDKGHSLSGQDSPALKAGPSRPAAPLVFAIDPGTTESGWCLFDAATCQVANAGVDPNHDVLTWVKHGQSAHLLAIEMIAGMGMTVGQTTFETVRWIGRFQQAWREPERVKLILRREVKSEICGNQRAKDQNIRQALIDRLGEPGTKKKPGPTYGVSSHAWSALAVAVTSLERAGIRVQPKQAALLAAAEGAF